MSQRPIALDRVTARRSLHAATGFLSSEVRWRVHGQVALLIGFALAIKDLNVVNSNVARDFMTAIPRRDRAVFVQPAALYVGVFAGSTAVAVLYRFTQERLALFWLVWLTSRRRRGERRNPTRR